MTLIDKLQEIINQHDDPDLEEILTDPEKLADMQENVWMDGNSDDAFSIGHEVGTTSIIMQLKKIMAETPDAWNSKKDQE